MWNEQKRILDAQLSLGESLLWSGRPRSGFFFRSTDLFTIPFSLLWGGFAIFWNYAVWQSKNSPLFFRLWGIPFLVVGLHMIVGRFFVDVWQRSKTYYGVTSERIIIISGLFATNTKSLNLRTLTDVSLTEQSNGSGTISFGPPSTASNWGSNLPFSIRRNEVVYPEFDSIPDAKRTYDIIRNAQRTAL